jgi:PAS domain S-box-containing protein
MEETVSEARAKYSHLASRLSTIIAVFGAALTLAWLSGLGSVLNRLSAIRITRPLSGLSFLLSGFALWIYSEDRPDIHAGASAKGQKDSLILAARISGLLILLFSALTFLEYITGIRLHLESALVGPLWSSHKVHMDGQMSPLVAAGFLLAGLIFIVFDRRIGRTVFPAEVLALVVLTISIDSFITYLYIVNGPVGLISDDPIPIITALGFVLLSVGILAARKDRGLTAIWNAGYNGSRLLRRYLPVAVVAFIVVGGILDFTRDQGILTRANGYAIYAIVMILFTAIVAFISAISLNGAEHDLIRANKLYDVLSQSNQALVRTKNISVLLKKVCNIFIERGGFKMAWAGLRDDDQSDLRIVACSGQGSEEFLAESAFLDDMTNVEGIRQVLRGAEHSIFNDIEKDLPPSSSKERMVERGDGSMVVFPLKKRGKAIGVLCALSEERAFFQHDQMKLLEEVAMDMSFALDEIERDKEKQAADDARAKTEALYEEFFEEDLTADFITTPKGEILSCNPAFVRIFGFSDMKEALKTNAMMIYPTEAERESLLTLLRSRKKLEYHEHWVRRQDGQPLYIVENAIGQFDENGELIQIKHYVFDDTKRKTLEGEMIQGQKMESIGTLAGGIAHDFNNLLGIIIGYAGIMAKHASDKKKLDAAIDAITNAAHRGVGLVRQLLTFARKEERIVEYLNLNDSAEEVFKLLEETFPKSIEIQHDLKEEIPFIMGDKTQLHQAILNLCVNARDAMMDRPDGKPSGGTLRVTTTTADHESMIAEFPKATANTYVQISVTDTGMGMDEATRQHIFEPFFTTKEAGKGTGLGLATVYGIVQAHSGFINVSSVPGVGTTFSIYLPAALRPLEGLTAEYVDMDDAPGGTETILVVEDEALLRGLLEDSLKSNGYNVIIAESGQKAVTVYKAEYRHIALVVSDVGLPKLGGIDMLKALKKINPDVKVIFASGFLAPESRAALFTSGALGFIQKPYAIKEVLKKLRAALDL